VTVTSAPGVASVLLKIIETGQTQSVALDTDGVGEWDLSAHSGFTRTVRFDDQAVYGDAQITIEVP
jgi:hypothetical protein